MSTEPDRRARQRRGLWTLTSWLLFPILLLMQLFDLRRGLVGPGWVWSALLIGFSLFLLVGTPLAITLRARLSRPDWTVAGLFTALVAWGIGSALVSGPPLWPWRTLPTATPPRVLMPAPLLYRIVPLVTAWVTMAAAGLAVGLIPARSRLERMWWLAALMLGSSLALWPRAIEVHNSPRLATGMGGSSTVHLVFLLCAGLFLGAFWQRHRPRASLALAGVSVLCLLMTGSRAGFLALAAFVVLVLVWIGAKLNPRLVLAVLIAGVVGLGLVLLTPASRLLNFSDPWRVINARTALRLWTADPLHLLLGVGSGRVWPWYAFDARFYWLPWGGRLRTSAGDLLTNPHSVPLGVGVELGLVGLLLLAGIIVLLFVAVGDAWRTRGPASGENGRAGAREGVLLALVASLVTFVFDYYLLKNFAVSFWWWCAVFATLGGVQRSSGPSSVTSSSAASTRSSAESSASSTRSEG